ncbi:trehalose-phosphatase [Brevundimonas sp. NIBR11]|uniref:trehalose-phosphatase n=1 Tax=Brevundimonas sp. NIBR11 TaxID=3015999 RepID=UPI0022F0E3C2|nr:trehalose-phosphatase [Brevundimonas sp. NIBR11]WGM29884.1 Trehalose-6-phosphate phosphatase [Brevundimonas sp. NIBR11]
MPSDTGTLIRTLPAPPVAITRPLALFLDLDGVLAPMAPTPDAVIANPRRTAVLSRLDRALDGRLAIVSGRTLAEIDRIAEGASPAAAGVHGLERRRRDGDIDRPAPSPGVAEALAAFRDFAADRPGVIVEDKSISTGLHYRQSPDSADEALVLARTLARRTGLTLQPGHMVLELRTPGADKGGAVTAFMAEAPFAGATPVMLGDDLTDEAGFRAAEAFGGFGVLVGPYRNTAARYGLSGVPEVLDWLEAVADAEISA